MIAWNAPPEKADWYFSVVVEIWGGRSVIDGYTIGDKPTLPKLRAFSGWPRSSQLKAIQWMVLRAGDPNINRNPENDDVPVDLSVLPGDVRGDLVETAGIAIWETAGVAPGGGATQLFAVAKPVAERWAGRVVDYPKGPTVIDGNIVGAQPAIEGPKHAGAGVHHRRIRERRRIGTEVRRRWESLRTSAMTSGRGRVTT